MKHIGIAEAQTQLSSLIREVEGGHEVVLTRDGRPVAKLVHIDDTLATGLPNEQRIAKRRQAVARLRQIARGLDIQATQEEIKSWIEEGRR